MNRHLIWTLALAAATVASPALGAPQERGSVEVAVDVAHVPTSSSLAYESISDRSGAWTAGASAAWERSPWLGVQAAWGTWATGVRLEGGGNTTYGYEDGYDGSGGDLPGGELATAFRGNGLTVGVRSGPLLWHRVQPFATVRGGLLVGTLRLDDDPDDDENPNQLVARGLTPGFVAAGGVRLGTSDERDLAVFHQSEVGYALWAPLNLGDYGELALRGVHFRASLGMRF